MNKPKKLHIRLVNKATGEFNEYNTKEFYTDTKQYNDVVHCLVEHLHKVLDSPDDHLLVIDNITSIKFVEGGLFDFTSSDEVTHAPCRSKQDNIV